MKNTLLDLFVYISLLCIYIGGIALLIYICDKTGISKKIREFLELLGFDFDEHQEPRFDK